MERINEAQAGFEKPKNEVRYYQLYGNKTEPEVIPSQLPPSYRIATNKNNCGNCAFYINNICSKWGAKVRAYHEAPWICNAWQPIVQHQDLQVDEKGNPIEVKYVK